MTSNDKIVLRVTPELKAQAQKLAADQNRTLSGLIKHLITEATKTAS